MTKQASAVSLEEREEALRNDHGDSVQVAEIASVVGKLMEGTSQDTGLQNIATELRELLEYIRAAENELVAMQPKALSGYHIPDAHEQLDAIVKSTEDAAGTIMDAAETATELAEVTEGDVSEKLMDMSTNLFEASSFQDLTGQRITKITTTLGHLEERLSSLADAIGDEYLPQGDDIEKDAEGVAVHDEDLLHGPQLEGQGNSQEDIDALLASFD